MLHPENIREMSHQVTDMMEDIWHKRSYLPETMYLVFRLEATQHEPEDITARAFVHFLITPEFWYAKVSDEQFGMTLKELTARLPDEDLYKNDQVQSWRHYAFGDLLQPMINDYLEAKVKEFGITHIYRCYIWDTFPAQTVPSK